MSSSSSGMLLNSIVGRKPDLAPSILFTILYTFVLPVGIWRYFKLEPRTGTLIRPLLFCLIRIGTYIVRALMAQGNHSTGIIVTEMVLFTTGAVLVIEPLIGLSRQLLERSVPYDGPTIDENGRKLSRKDRIGWLVTILDLALLASVAIAIYSATITSKAFGDPHTARTVQRLRRGSAIIFTVVVGLLIVALGYYHFFKRVLNPRSTYFLLMVGFLNMITCALRLAQAYQTAGASSLVAFWLAQATPELLLAIAYLSVNLNTLVPEEKPQVLQMRSMESIDNRAEGRSQPAV